MRSCTAQERCVLNRILIHADEMHYNHQCTIDEQLKQCSCKSKGCLQHCPGDPSHTSPPIPCAPTCAVKQHQNGVFTEWFGGADVLEALLVARERIVCMKPRVAHSMNWVALMLLALRPQSIKTHQPSEGFAFHTIAVYTELLQYQCGDDGK
jgi:hypothetical protein